MSSPAPGAPEGQATLLAIGSSVGAAVASRFLRVLKVLALARLLAPEDYGVAAALAIILTYAQFLDLGTSAAAFRALASAVGRADAQEAQRTAAWMSAFKVFTALVVGAGALGALLLPNLSPPLRLGLVALPVIALSSTLLSQVVLHLQARGAIRDFSRVTALAALSDLVLCVGLVWLWSLPGLLAGMALSPLLPLAWAAARGASLRPALPPWGVVQDYLKTGLPLVSLSFLDLSLVSIDQLVVLSLLSVRDLGLYNVALLAPEAVRTVGTAAGAVLGPRLLREYARAGGRIEAVRRHTLLPVQLYASALPLPIALLGLGGSFFVQRFYPLYLGAVPAMLFLLVAIDFLVVVGGVTTFLFAIDRHHRNLLILAPAVCFNVLVDVVLVRAGGGLAAVAFGSLLTYSSYALVVLWYVAGHFRLAPREWWRFQAGALLPGILLGLFLFLAERFFPYRDSLPWTLAACATAVVVFTPLAWRAVRLARQMDENWTSPSS